MIWHSRRRLHNLLLFPRKQLKLPLALSLATFLFAGLLAYFTSFTFGRLYDFCTVTMGGGKPTEAIEAQLTAFVVFVSLLLLFYLLFVGITCLIYSHRLLGPTVTILREIEALRRGEYGSRITLRKRDMLQEVAQALNELAETLEGKSARSSGEGEEQT